MPLRIGAWWPDNQEASPHSGYSRVTIRADGGVTSDGRYRGKLIEYRIRYGRVPGQIHYTGGTCELVIEDWDFLSNEIVVGQPMAVRWDSGDDSLALAADRRDWPKGPPCMFAGFVVSYPTEFPEKGDPDHSITTITLHDAMGKWAADTKWVHGFGSDDVFQDNAWGWVQRTRGVRNHVEGVLLDDALEDQRLGTDGAVWGQWNISQAITQVCSTAGVEIFVRHGERIGGRAGQGPPLEDGTHESEDGIFARRAERFFIRPPQMVLRKVGGFTPARTGPPAVEGNAVRTTFGTPGYALTDDDESVPTSDNRTQTGAPIQVRHDLTGRHGPIAVSFPPIMDRVSLYSQDYEPPIFPSTTPQDGHEGNDETIHGVFEKDYMERRNLPTPVPLTQQFRDQLDANAKLFLDGNSSTFKLYSVPVENVSDDEMKLYAGIGVGDECMIDRLDDLRHNTLTSPICEVRHVDWHGTRGGVRNLLLLVTPVVDAPTVAPEPGPTAFWAATITWGHDDDSEDSGYDAPGGVQVYGDIDNRDIDADRDGTPDAQLDVLIRLDDGRVRLQVGTEAEYDLLEGKYLQMTNVAPFPLWMVLPTGDTRGNTISVIPENEKPAVGHLVRVALWDELPSNAMLAPELVAMPGEIGVQRDTAVDSLQRAGFTVVVTTEEDDANVGRVISSTPAPGVLVRPGSEVSIAVGVAVPVQTVEVPNVFGLLEAQARTDIEAAGLVVNFIDDDQTSGTDNQVLSQSPAAGTEVAVGSTVTVTIRNVVAAPPQKLRDMVLTWHQSAHEDPRQGYSQMPPDAGPYGSLTPNEVTIDPIVVRILRLAERGLVAQDPPDPNEGKVLITCENADQMAALAGNWIRMEPTGVPTEDVIFQIPEPDEGSEEVETEAGLFPADRVPADGTQIAVSIWDLEPVGQPRTEPYPTAGTTTTVPDLAGQTETAARQGLANLGLVVGGTRDEDQTTGTDDRVIRTEPAAGQPIAVGGSVLIVLRNRVDVMVQVPDLTGLLQGAARTAVEDAGLMPVFTHTTQNTGIDDEVISQSPAAGTTVAQGSTVTVEIRNLVPAKQWSGTLQLDSSGSWHGHPYGDSSLTEHDDDLGIVISRLDMNRTAGAGSNGAVRIWCETAAQVNAIEGKWMRIETTNEHSGDIIFQIAESATTRISNDFDLTDIATPLDDTRVAVSIWSADPTGLARTANLPTVLVPDVYEETDADARTAISDANLTPGTTTDEDETVSEAGGADDRVIRTSPARDDRVLYGATVNIVLRNVIADPVTQVAIPDLAGLTVAAAQTRLQEVGLVAAADFGPDTNTLIEDDDNLVRSTTPVAGSLVDSGHVVTLNLWNYHGVEVPSIVGLTVTGATNALTALNLTLGAAGDEIDVVNQLHNDRIQAQTVAANTVVAPQTAIGYQLGRLVAPDLDGLTQAQAEAAVTLAGLIGTATDTTTPTLALDNTVVAGSQSPAAGDPVQPGAGISYQLYDFEGIIVPNLIGQPRNLAQGNLEGLGLVVAFADGTETTDAANENRVESMSPGPGMEVESGSTVTLTIWDYEAAEVAMPNLVGMSQAAAETALTAAGLMFTVGTQETSTVSQIGQVLAQDPGAGTMVAAGSTVSFTVGVAVTLGMLFEAQMVWTSIGPDTRGYGFTTPNTSMTPDTGTIGGVEVMFESMSLNHVTGNFGLTVRGTTEMDALQGKWLLLEGAGGGLGRLTLEVPMEVTGDHYTWAGARTGMTPTLVSFEVWDVNPSAITVPDVTGDSESEARTAIEAAHLEVGTVTRMNELTGDDDAVISTSPAAGTTVNGGSTVDIVVRNLQAVVPDTTDNTESAARTTLTNAGFVVGTVTDEDQTEGDDDRVIRTNPAAGQQVDHGSTVDIVLRNLVEEPVGPTALWSASLVVGTASSGNVGFQAVSDYWGFTTAVGSLTPAAITIDGISATWAVWQWNASPDWMQIGTSAFEQTFWEALHNKWVKVTLANGNTYIAQIPAAYESHSFTGITENPAVGDTVTVEIFGEDPS